MIWLFGLLYGGCVICGCYIWLFRYCSFGICFSTYFTLLCWLLLPWNNSQPFPLHTCCSCCWYGDRSMNVHFFSSCCCVFWIEGSASACVHMIYVSPSIMVSSIGYITIRKMLVIFCSRSFARILLFVCSSYSWYSPFLSSSFSSLDQGVSFIIWL